MLPGLRPNTFLTKTIYSQSCIFFLINSKNVIIANPGMSTTIIKKKKRCIFCGIKQISVPFTKLHELKWSHVLFSVWMWVRVTYYKDVTIAQLMTIFFPICLSSILNSSGWGWKKCGSEVVLAFDRSVSSQWVRSHRCQALEPSGTRCGLSGSIPATATHRLYFIICRCVAGSVQLFVGSAFWNWCACMQQLQPLVLIRS